MFPGRPLVSHRQHRKPWRRDRTDPLWREILLWVEPQCHGPTMTIWFIDSTGRLSRRTLAWDQRSFFFKPCPCHQANMIIRSKNTRWVARHHICYHSAPGFKPSRNLGISFSANSVWVSISRYLRVRILTPWLETWLHHDVMNLKGAECSEDTSLVLAV